jgi:hypothetical protein
MILNMTKDLPLAFVYCSGIESLSNTVVPTHGILIELLVRKAIAMHMKSGHCHLFCRMLETVHRLTHDLPGRKH